MTSDDTVGAPRGDQIGVALTLARRNVTYRVIRTLLLCAGFGVGVGVMIVLLAVGEAMVTQASREQLVGGGDVTVLPEGIDIEVLTTGGLGGMFFSIPNARFVARQVLGAPRLAASVSQAAPQLEGKLLYLTTPDGVSHTVRASGEIPSASRALGAVPRVASGQWEDDDGDRRWLAPTTAELRHDIDHFHLPPPTMARRDSWAEWHYFNILSADARQWAFISYIIGGDPTSARWGGQFLITLHERGRPARRFVANVPQTEVRFSLRDADLAMGTNSVRVLPDGRYAVRGTAREEVTGAIAQLDLTVSPVPRADFPGATLLSGDFTSGYAVAGLRANASGSLCVRGPRDTCVRFDGAQAYHDHNWGGWAGVSWEWGATRAGSYTLLYGRVNPEQGTDGDASDGATSPLFVYLVDSGGFAAVFRPRSIAYDDGRIVQTVDGPLRVPSRATLRDIRGADTLTLTIDIDDAVASDTRVSGAERGEGLEARRLNRPWFVQMAGQATIGGRLRGVPLQGTGRGFFETYR